MCKWSLLFEYFSSPFSLSFGHLLLVPFITTPHSDMSALFKSWLLISFTFSFIFYLSSSARLPCFMHPGCASLEYEDRGSHYAIPFVSAAMPRDFDHPFLFPHYFVPLSFFNYILEELSALRPSQSKVPLFIFSYFALVTVKALDSRVIWTRI
ncbi:hypothetical protein CPC08DRAFT_418216 [Agrocybe pediades]|nr:hypothetical protein CPC08DRAFT_418216 [Agrocybe pediades]